MPRFPHVLTIVSLLAISSLPFPVEGQGRELLDYNPVADPSAVIISGNARFTVLTDHLVRMEYSSSGNWSDVPTLAVLNRKLTVPAYTKSEDDTFMNITIPGGGPLVVSYKKGGKFDSTNLVVSSPAFKQSWVPGTIPSGNLLGTIRSLDTIGGPITLNCTENAKIVVHEEGLHCAWGLISKDGWSVVDDSDTPLIGPDGWVSTLKSADDQDWYMLGHGLQFRLALKDWQEISGKIAMVPRYALGTWWSRWYDVSGGDTKEIIEDYASRSIPLDVYVLDMDWHPLPWTGYSWDTNLFPYPKDILDWHKAKGLHNTANLHDASGVAPFEKMYPEMAKAMGVDPSSNQTIDFAITNLNYSINLEDIVLKPIENDGMDFWWIDWQQGGKQGGCTGGKLNPTILTNKLRATDHLRRGENVRGMVLARWGGYGNQRYQIGFSGDVNHSWESLAFQPYFSATASNVGYGFWSHDIIAQGRDHEMQTRWVQWGAYSAIFRSHDAGGSAGSCNNNNPTTCATVELWNVPPKYFEANRAVLQYRAALVPYLYNLVRIAFDEGLSPVRPMYYDYNDAQFLDDAIAALNPNNRTQYMLGDDMFVAPVCAPADASNNMTSWTVWVPPGAWYEQDAGREWTEASSRDWTNLYDLTEVPVWIRGGAIIPRIPFNNGDSLGTAQRPYTSLELSIYPGANEGSNTLYEDDGKTLDYLKATGGYRKVTTKYTRPDPLTYEIDVAAESNDTVPSLPSEVQYTFKLVNTFPLAEVTCGGQSLPYARFGGVGTWTYDGETTTVIISLAPQYLSSMCKVTAKVDAAFKGESLSGIRGYISRANLAKKNLDLTRVAVASRESLTRLAVLGEVLSVTAQDSTAFLAAVRSASDLLGAAISEMKALLTSQLRLVDVRPQSGAKMIEQAATARRNMRILQKTSANKNTRQHVSQYGIIAEGVNKQRVTYSLALLESSMGPQQATKKGVTVRTVPRRK